MEENLNILLMNDGWLKEGNSRWVKERKDARQLRVYLNNTSTRTPN